MNGARLVWKASDLRPMLEHAKAAKEFQMPFGYENKQKEPGLLFVKDDGIYLMSNGRPAQEATGPVVPGKAKLLCVYAQGFESPSRHGVFDDAGYQRIREAVGGDDFCEFIPASFFSRMTDKDVFTIKVRPGEMRLMLKVPGTGF